MSRGVSDGTSVRDRKDRITTGDARVIEFKLCDKQGARIDSVSLGDTLRLVMTVEFHRPVDNAVFGVLVHSTAGDPMLNLRSSHEGMVVDRSEGRLTVEVVVGEIGLYPGGYTLSPYVSDEVRRIYIDCVQHLSRLWILPARGKYASLRLNPSLGKYFVPSSWRILESGGQESSPTAESDKR
jgi:hypothetical protein